MVLTLLIKSLGLIIWSYEVTDLLVSTVNSKYSCFTVNQMKLQFILIIKVQPYLKSDYIIWHVFHYLRTLCVQMRNRCSLKPVDFISSRRDELNDRGGQTDCAAFIGVYKHCRSCYPLLRGETPKEKRIKGRAWGFSVRLFSCSKRK